MGHSSRTRWVSSWEACPGRQGDGTPPTGLAALLGEVSCHSQAGFALGFGMGGVSRDVLVRAVGILRLQLAVGLQRALLHTQCGARSGAGLGLSRSLRLSWPLGLSWPLSAGLWLLCQPPAPQHCWLGAGGCSAHRGFHVRSCRAWAGGAGGVSLPVSLRSPGLLQFCQHLLQDLPGLLVLVLCLCPGCQPLAALHPAHLSLHLLQLLQGELH